MASKNQKQLETAKAKELIQENARKYFTSKVKIPLGNPALKNVHTNQFLWMDLPKEFAVDNWELIAKVLNGSSTRFSGVDYVNTRWYIEGCTIDVDVTGKAEMSLDLNAFASSTSEFTADYRSYKKAYDDVVNKASSTNNGSTKKKTNAVASENTTVKEGWWGKWVTEMVRKNVGNETDVLKKCKKMYQVFCDHTVYRLYYNAKYTHSGVNSYERVWKSGEWLNCGDGANILCAFMAACGANPTILNGSGCGYGHYVVKVVIGGATYWCDHASDTGLHTTRGWGNTFCSIRSGSSEGTHIDYA